MGFLTPAFLWALPLSSIPIVLYLLFRRRRRDTSWGAMYILRQVIETKSRHIIWLQYLIVALRTVAFASLMLLFAQPFLPWRAPRGGAFPPAPPSTHRIILLDTSESMQARFATGQAREAALSLCRKILDAGRFPGETDLLPLDGRNDPYRFESFPVEADRLESVLAECVVPARRFDLDQGLRVALDLFRASPHSRRELYLLSDFNARDFAGQPADASLWVRLQRRNVAVHLLRYHQPGTRNFAVTELTPIGDVLLAQQPTQFYLTVAYSGDAEQADTVLSIELDDRQVLHEQALSLTPGEKTLAVPLQLPAGEHRLTATLGDDDLALDNVLRREFLVRDRLRVMVFQNIVVAGGFDNARTWLEMALANPARRADPQARTKFTSAAEAYAAATRGGREEALTGAADAAARPFEIDLEGKIPEQLSAELLRGADCLILLDMANLSLEAVAILRQYVVAGGTILLAPGPTVSAEEFNESYPDLAPSALAPPRYETIDPERYEQAVAEAGEDRIWRELELPQHGNLGSPRFYNYYTPPATDLAPDSRVLLALSDGSPLLLERRLGRGAVFLWTAGLGGQWQSMVVHPAYPVFLMRFLNQAAARRSFPRNLRPGDPILLAAEVPQARVVRPDGTSEVVDTVTVGSRPFLRYDHTDRPGLYDVRLDPASETPGLPFFVARDYRESDLQPLRGQARTDFEALSGVTLLDDEAALVRAVGASYPGRSGVLPAALVLLGGLLLEAGLARRFFA